ncbi:hypothetical protein D3C72_2404850 [compost metagenome]
MKFHGPAAEGFVGAARLIARSMPGANIGVKLPGAAATVALLQAVPFFKKGEARPTSGIASAPEAERLVRVSEAL